MFKSKVFMPFAVLGDPNYEESLKIIQGFVKNGAGALELGFAFSDPIADGPVIQKANNRALEKGITTKKAFEIIASVRKETTIPISVMLSYNIVYNYGVENFYKKCAELKVDGVLCPDVPLEEAEELITLSKKYKLAQIFIVSPTTTKERMGLLNKYASGYTYMVSLLGTTGVKTELNTKLPAMIKLCKKEMNLPLYVGFGISQPQHAANVIKLGADGAISGSAICKIVEENLTNPKEMQEKINKFCKEMSEAVKNAWYFARNSWK